MRQLESLDEPSSADRVTELVLGLYKKIEASFLYKDKGHFSKIISVPPLKLLTNVINGNKIYLIDSC